MLSREYTWNVKNKATKGYEEMYFFLERGGQFCYNELETRVRLTKRRKTGKNYTFQGFPIIFLNTGVKIQVFLLWCLRQDFILVFQFKPRPQPAPSRDMDRHYHLATSFGENQCEFEKKMKLGLTFDLV